MEPYKIISEIIKDPDVPKFYRMLQEFYRKKNMENESNAILKLLEIKFNNNVSDN